MDDFPDKTAEDIPKEEPKKEIDFMEMLNNPLAKELLGGCKDLFKKEKSDPDVCEITIKAPSDVVLKLFKVSEEKWSRMYLTKVS